MFCTLTRTFVGFLRSWYVLAECWQAYWALSRVGGGFGQDGRAGCDCSPADRRWGGSLQECQPQEFSLVREGERIPVRMYVCMRASYTGRLVADRAVDVSHGLQDVEGDKPNLVESIATLPPALGRFDDLPYKNDSLRALKCVSSTNASRRVVSLPQVFRPAALKAHCCSWL